MEDYSKYVLRISRVLSHSTEEALSLLESFGLSDQDSHLIMEGAKLLTDMLSEPVGSAYTNNCRGSVVVYQYFTKHVIDSASGTC